ncbi:hypothetical protein DPMN_155026 [Dreissena polymorpha]|uniref:Uncharacterized protein n=1 Tax=Dreissena polymorpha TaxID=45954 RepID=A0A9D4FSZ9_DREPO|nr:hypothetical protein DPMN_155026 [Dreissena polymorpha]
MFYVNGREIPVKPPLGFIDNGCLTGSPVKPPTGDPSNLQWEFNGNGCLAGASVNTHGGRKSTNTLFS